MTPRIGVCLGDPGGIGGELVAKLLADPALSGRGAIVMVGDPSHLARGQKIAGTDTAVRVVESFEEAEPAPGRPVLLVRTLPSGAAFPLGEANAEGGRYTLDCLETLVELARAGRIDALCYAPLNKHAMVLGGNPHVDELYWFADAFEFKGPVSDLTTHGGLWTARVTSHVAIRDVADMVTKQRVLDTIDVIHDTLTRAGIARPKIAVSALNPHAGDNGAFGREEIDVLTPTVAAARARGQNVDGPFSPDTCFVIAKREGYNAIVNMYHDQSQIAMKVMGFERGCSVMGGLPAPIATPSHGTAYDIVGKGIAGTGAFFAAFGLAADMGATVRRKAAA